MLSPLMVETRKWILDMGLAHRIGCDDTLKWRLLFRRNEVVLRDLFGSCIQSCRQTIDMVSNTRILNLCYTCDSPLFGILIRPR